MGNPLRDQLKKAKLLSKKDAKRLAHEERVHRKDVGREGIEKEQADRQQEIEQQRASERERDRARQQELEAARLEQQEVAACREILRTQVAAPGRGGRIRWFFETPSGHLPFLMLQPSEQHELGSGQLCVARKGSEHTHDYGLIPTEHARRVHAVFPERIVWSAEGALQ